MKRITLDEMKETLEMALEALQGMRDMWASVCISHGWEPNHLSQYDDAGKAIAALKEAIKNQGEPVGYVRKYALEHLKNTQAHTVIDAAPRADDDVALFVSSHEKKYQCIGVIDANGDIYPGQPDPGTQVYVALNADVDTSVPTIPQGWQLVPIEPTFEMIKAAVNSRDGYGHEYRAMLSAAPEYKGEQS